ncbi:MAG: hypothetical protein O9282_07955 [Flavobacterium sp.]|jgi:hypothetical protein|uniref:hypothetical protein n=1 Tax=Flavobacterium sp. TaxID=239 RepID=UPI0022C5D4BD|nr:hypothetical protein [Flavobacterium sp.]MCZ8331229.1 hypothetical protein [Flavobacterium sp.]
MKIYTQEDFNTLNNNAKDSFKKESNKQIKLFSDFIKNLETESIEPSEKVNKAFLEKDKIEYNLKDFIYINYPKTEEVFINGFVRYTLETVIFFNLIVDSFGESRKELERLYQDFFEKNFPQEQVP